MDPVTQTRYISPLYSGRQAFLAEDDPKDNIEDFLRKNSLCSAEHPDIPLRKGHLISLCGMSCSVFTHRENDIPASEVKEEAMVPYRREILVIGNPPWPLREEIEGRGYKIYPQPPNDC